MSTSWSYVRPFVFGIPWKRKIYLIKYRHFKGVLIFMLRKSSSNFVIIKSCWTSKQILWNWRIVFGSYTVRRQSSPHLTLNMSPSQIYALLIFQVSTISLSSGDLIWLCLQSVSANKTIVFISINRQAINFDWSW